MELDLKFYDEAKRYRLQSSMPPSDFHFMINSTEEFSGLFYILSVIYDRGMYVTRSKDGAKMTVEEILATVYEHSGMWRGIYINFSASGRWMPYLSVNPVGNWCGASSLAHSIKNGW